MSSLGKRIPDAKSERRLAEIRSSAAAQPLTSEGAAPAGAPFPKASPQTGYYGVPLLKEPQWKPEIPLYFFVGGAAGAAAVLAGVARLLSDDRELLKSARWVAAAGGVLSSGLLIADLGMPSRFLNMLRVFKPQSPMSVGAWTLAAFSSSSAAAAFANLLRERIKDVSSIAVVENAAAVLAAATGLIMSSYTGVLIGATAIPVWNNHIRTLPVHFAASGLNSAVSILELLGHDNNRQINQLGLAACAYETVQGAIIEVERSLTNRPLMTGRSGWIVRAGGVLSGPIPLALRIASGLSGNGKIRRAAALCSIIGSLLTRFGWMSAGRASARDASLALQSHESRPGESAQQEKAA